MHRNRRDRIYTGTVGGRLGLKVCCVSGMSSFRRPCDERECEDRRRLESGVDEAAAGPFGMMVEREFVRRQRKI